MYKSAVNLGSGGFGNVGYFADGGDVMALDMNQTAPGAPATYYDYLPEEMQQEAEQEDQKGFGTMIWDKLTGDDPTEGLRESARVGGSRTEALYGSDPTFMQQLIERYNYPSAFDPETGQQYIPTGFEPESVRMARPEGRRDLPTYPELEDARAHMLGSAIMAKEYGPENAETAGDFNEFLDRFAPFPLGGQNARDVAMDQRNNAVGRQIFTKAGMNASVQDLTRMVDAEVFNQLDKIMGRTPEERTTPAPGQARAPRNFVSPETGPDVYFPRNEQGYFDTTRRIMGISRPYRNY